MLLAVFALELGCRLAVWLWRRRRGEPRPWEALLLAVDAVAVASVLPLEGILLEARYFRVLRLARLALLFGYWGWMIRDLWAILSGRERRHQILFVVVSGALLSLAAAVVLSELAPQYDFDEDGVSGDRRSFGGILWWSFRQVQSPDNLVREPAHALVVAASLVLTFAGLMLFAFLVGIGTSAFDELLARAL